MKTLVFNELKRAMKRQKNEKNAIHRKIIERREKKR